MSNMSNVRREITKNIGRDILFLHFAENAVFTLENDQSTR